MLQDITMGLYIPGNSIAHRLDPRTKIILVICYVISLISASGIWSYCLVALMLAGAVTAAKIKPGMLLRGMRGFIIMIGFTSVLCVFLTPGAAWVQWGGLDLSKEGVYAGLQVLVCFILFIAGTSWLTFTTSPLQMMEGMGKLLYPLRYIKISPQEVALIMSVSMRFVPIMAEEAQRILSAQKARGAYVDSGNIAQRAQAMASLLAPLFIRAWQRSETLSTAMLCRCYQTGAERTGLRKMAMKRADYASLVLTSVILAVIIALPDYY
ncbi:MAG: energy-coupling factor transporter transmembrane protein EcfT [Syntrophomonadaceae bacterium]|jgi:energy-coupling factor transport system permease protein|nr:energy-coupling factor transporter transmembrane protein EcfT [Syntrophomonadaceae bacterium]